MGISRVQKFKEYRNSLIKEEAPDLKTPKSASKELNIESKEEYDTTSRSLSHLSAHRHFVWFPAH